MTIQRLIINCFVRQHDDSYKGVFPFFQGFITQREREILFLYADHACKQKVYLDVLINNASGQSCDQMNFLFARLKTPGKPCAYLQPCKLQKDFLSVNSRCIVKCPCQANSLCEVSIMTKSKYAVNNWSVCEIIIIK